MAINLLPTDLAPQRSIAKFVGLIKRLNLIGFSLFVIGILALLGYTIFLSSQLNSSNFQKEALSASLTSLQQTEQAVVLLKDRISKANSLLPLVDSYQNAEVFQELALSVPTDTSIREVKLASEVTELTLLFTNSSSLVSFVTALSQNENYARIEISAFSFNPTFGYLATFTLFS